MCRSAVPSIPQSPATVGLCDARVRNRTKANCPDCKTQLESYDSEESAGRIERKAQFRNVTNLQDSPNGQALQLILPGFSANPLNIRRPAEPSGSASNGGFRRTKGTR